MTQLSLAGVLIAVTNTRRISLGGIDSFPEK